MKYHSINDVENHPDMGFFCQWANSLFPGDFKVSIFPSEFEELFQNFSVTPSSLLLWHKRSETEEHDSRDGIRLLAC